MNIHDVVTQGANAAFSTTLNWNPAYSYAKIPDGMADYPDCWRVLVAPVPPPASRRRAARANS